MLLHSLTSRQAAYFAVGMIMELKHIILRRRKDASTCACVWIHVSSDCDNEKMWILHTSVFYKCNVKTKARGWIHPENCVTSWTRCIRSAARGARDSLVLNSSSEQWISVCLGLYVWPAAIERCSGVSSLCVERSELNRNKSLLGGALSFHRQQTYINKWRDINFFQLQT